MRKPVALAGIMLIALIGLMAVAINAQITQAQDRPTLRLIAGLGEGVVSANDFIGDPNLGGTNVRVAEGTRVVWTLGSDEAHTITFLAGQPMQPYFMLQPEDPSRAPMINPIFMFPTLPQGPWDGTSFVHGELLQRGQEVEVTFGRPGRYEYVCLFHPPMIGTVEVVAAGASGITTQAAVDQLGAVHYTVDHSWQVAEMMATRNTATRIDGPRGTAISMVRAGTDWRWGHVDVQAFMPDRVTINQGDTVVWYVDHIAPHTITFASIDGTPPDLIVVQLPDGRTVPPPPPNAPPPPEFLALLEDPDFMPRLVFGTGALRTNDPVHDGRNMYTSGVIGEHPTFGFPLEKTWGLTFNTPGTFEYTCLLHEQIGMKGTVSVLAR